jgi:hypothetical protein
VVSVPPPARFRPLLSSFVLLLLIPIVSDSTFAQSPPITRKVPPPPPAPPAVDQEQVISYWTTETGWTSELQLRNNAVAQDLTVTPALRLPDGAETLLAPVTIKPQEVRSVDIASAVAAASAPQLVGTYGSVVLRYRSASLGSLYAAMMIRAMGHAIAFHVDASAEFQDLPAGSREGIWWLPKDTTSDYLILANQGNNALSLDLSLYDASGTESKQKVLLGPHDTSRFSVRRLLQAAGLAGSYGGIKVSAAAHAGSLDTLHFLFDEGANFSAILKMFNHDPNAKIAERDFTGSGVWTLRAPMLALSNPDSALAFPPGTTLQPQILIRNTTGKPVDAALRFNWRTGSTTGKAQGPQLHLLPYQTRLIDVAALQDAAVLPNQANWASVTLTSDALPDELMAVAASYDQTLKYGAQTPFFDQLSHRWKGGMWEFDPYHNSIITAGNGGAKPAQAAFTIFYNQGTQRYDLEQTLQPDEQMWIDIGKLIREHVLDKNGKTLPADLTSGSYEIRDLTHTGVGALFEGKITYDKTYSHAAYGCAICCGYSAAHLWFDPIDILDGSYADDGVFGYNACDMQWEDISDSFYGNWSSGNTAIVTVDTYGTHTGVSLGSTTSQTNGDVEGTRSPPTCPLRGFAPGGGANVTPSVTFGDTPLVPLGKPVQTTATVSPSTNTASITLTISVTSGTGSATFDNGSTTKTITSTTSLTLVGVTASSSPNNMQLTATAGGATVGSMIFTVTGPINGAIPVNFRQTVATINPGAVLHFEYTWDSSSGNKADLSTCQVEEYVTYVGPNPYPWASPPYLAGYTTTWPELGGTPIPASDSGLQDNHSHVPGWLKPYVFNFAASDQRYQFQCPYYQNGQWVQLMPIVGTIAISRVVSLTNGAPPWTYEITKSGLSASINLP